jgi:hypothetical protein
MIFCANIAESALFYDFSEIKETGDESSTMLDSISNFKQNPHKVSLIQVTEAEAGSCFESAT